MVGGTVRDLLLGGTPKDFDLLSSAEPHQVRVGRVAQQSLVGGTELGWGGAVSPMVQRPAITQHVPPSALSPCCASR